MAVRRVLANLLCTDQPTDLQELQQIVCCSTLSALRELVDALKATIKDKTKPPSLKVKALKALSVCVEHGSGELIAYTGKKIMSRLTKLALVNKELDNEKRGAEMFGAMDFRERRASFDFLMTLLLCIRTWAQKYPTLGGSDSVFKKSYMRVLAKVSFPPDPRQEEELQQLQQFKREVLHVQHLLESTSPRHEIAPLVDQLRKRQEDVTTALQVPNKHMRMLLTLNDMLTNTLNQFDELYPEPRLSHVSLPLPSQVSLPHPCAPRACPLPANFTEISEPQPIPEPPSHARKSINGKRLVLPIAQLTQYEPSTPQSNQFLGKLDELCSVIRNQEVSIAQLTRELQDSLQLVETRTRERDTALQNLRACRMERDTLAMRGADMRASVNMQSLESSFLAVQPKDGELTSRWGAFDDLETAVAEQIANSKLAQRSFAFQRGVLYSGEINCSFCWTGPRVLTLTIRSQEVLTDVTLSTNEVQIMGIAHWEVLAIDTEARTKIQVQPPSDLFNLPTVRISFSAMGKTDNLTLALPVGPVQTVTRNDIEANECVELWNDLSPFQTARKFSGLRRELKSMQAVAVAVSFSDTFKSFSVAEIPRLGRGTLLLTGKAFEKDVLACVSLNKDATGGMIALRCAHVRLREALAPCFLNALVA